MLLRANSPSIFWPHKAMSQFQPHKFENAKLDASISTPIRDLNNSLQVIKIAK
jgi:hypothetical protein